MLKISFWLKKPESTQSSLENITLTNPKKVSEGNLVGLYASEIYLPNIKEKFPVYAANPIDALYNALSCIRIYLQNRVVKHGYKISEAENGES